MSKNKPRMPRLLEKLKPAAAADKTALTKGWEHALESGPQAMAAFHAARQERIERNRK
ncbi:MULTISPECIES: hypothetical protein [Acidovorax]|jgi:hypothetical protein|uniref:hypothetical protein n=1 Tax=Acidovorax TaxID=12916 RepID=UPI0013565641|nr:MULTISPECIES: hypothetical protein [Acidovorax]